ncbi:hypothetical protein DRJ22_00195 [Candidatus Woesearchaeota archaeon]|nr:MAG: hypothetical protein DRJ22_00195 [Candidatus Woesearchaeota archaeon]
MLKYFFLGLFIKIITGLDDTITHIPILASLTKRKTGRTAFATGIFIAIITGIILSIFLAKGIKKISYSKYISAGLIFLLAILIYFDVIIHKPRKKAEEKIQKISAKRLTTILGIGFAAGIATVLDDVIAFAPLFLKNNTNNIAAITGILTAAILEILMLLYASKKIIKLKNKEKIASIGLAILGVLTLIGVV